VLVAALGARLVVQEGGEVADGRARGWFDQDHIRAQVRQDPRCEAHRLAGEVQHANARERSHGLAAALHCLDRHAIAPTGRHDTSPDEVLGNIGLRGDQFAPGGVISEW
jgi:hypothetical protein